MPDLPGHMNPRVLGRDGELYLYRGKNVATFGGNGKTYHATATDKGLVVHRGEPVLIPWELIMSIVDVHLDNQEADDE